jgi:hypothetical protein
MSVSTILVAASLLTATILILRYFWFELVVIVATIYIAVRLAILSFISMLLWMIFVEGSKEGWGLCWLYFFLGYLAIVLLYAFLAVGIYSNILDALKGNRRR